MTALLALSSHRATHTDEEMLSVTPPIEKREKREKAWREGSVVIARREKSAKSGESSGPPGLHRFDRCCLELLADLADRATP